MLVNSSAAGTSNTSKSTTATQLLLLLLVVLLDSDTDISHCYAAMLIVVAEPKKSGCAWSSHIASAI